MSQDALHPLTGVQGLQQLQQILDVLHSLPGGVAARNEPCTHQPFSKQVPVRTGCWRSVWPQGMLSAQMHHVLAASPAAVGRLQALGVRQRGGQLWAGHWRWPTPHQGRS